MVRGKDTCWQYCALVDANRQKVRCNFCQREFSGGVYRMKFHLAQIKNKDIVPCTNVPTEIRDRVSSLINSPKKERSAKKLKLDQQSIPENNNANGHQNSSSASGEFQHLNRGQSSGHQNISTCPSVDRGQREFEDDDNIQKRKQDEADKRIAMFFFNNCVPLNSAKSVYYQEMVDSIAECGVGYKAPSLETLRSSLLERVKLEIHDLFKRYRDEWTETGCTLICDTWSDYSTTKSIVVFSVTSPKGSLYLKSINLSDNKDDPNFLFSVIESVVLEIGVENLVHVLTDNSASFAFAGRLLMAKYSSLFWSPCASCCIDNILEDFARLGWVKTVLEEAKTITRYIYSHLWSLSITRKFTGGRELMRPKIKGFVGSFLSLRSIVIQEDNLKHMISHPEWLLSSAQSQQPEAQAMKSLLYLDRFWSHAREAVSVSEPLVKIMRILDGDCPSMGYLFEGIERAKNIIKAYYKGIEEKYTPIWEMIERRWVLSSFHSAGAFLNPSVFYNRSFKVDPRLRNGFQEAMMRIAITEIDKIKITKECPRYINAHGALGTDFAILGRTINSPSDWWAVYGYEIATIQRVAIRILSQRCSSNRWQWNWETFDNLHSKKREGAESEKLNDLVFVHCNLWLQQECKNEKFKDVVVFDEIDVGSEWPCESNNSAPLLDDSWLDNLALDCRASP